MSDSGKKRLSPDFCEWPTCPGVPGHPSLVQRHRIIPGRKPYGGKYKKGNVISLCPNCHLLADIGIIPREVLQIIVQLRLEREEVQYLSEEEASERVSSEQDCEGWEASGMQKLQELSKEIAIPAESRAPEEEIQGSMGEDESAD